jgi:hypothetical protein
MASPWRRHPRIDRPNPHLLRIAISELGQKECPFLAQLNYSGRNRLGLAGGMDFAL